MLTAALAQAWPPFVLVASLLVIGAVAHRDGLFERLGALLEALPGPPLALFAAACLLLALTTALLNLDTAVVFAMPVVVLAARRRGIEETAFVYAALFMVNAASLYLPGSNLTNLLVLAGQPREPGYAVHMLVPGLAATVITAAGLAIAHRRGLIAARVPTAPGGAGRLIGTGSLGALAAAVLMVIFTNPALPVAVVALIVAATSVGRRQLGTRQLAAAASPQVLILLLAVAVALGVLARAWGGPGHLLAHAGRIETAAVAGAATVLVNNLPAATMLSAHAVAAPRALIIGLDLGPNLAVTGSLAAFLWLRTAATLDAAASPLRVTRLGIVLAPLAAAAALALSSG